MGPRGPAMRSTLTRKNKIPPLQAALRPHPQDPIRDTLQALDGPQPHQSHRLASPRPSHGKGLAPGAWASWVWRVCARGGLLEPQARGKESMELAPFPARRCQREREHDMPVLVLLGIAGFIMEMASTPWCDSCSLGWWTSVWYREEPCAS